MTQTTKAVLDLVASMERAKANNLTDADQARKDLAFRLLDDLRALCEKYHATTRESLVLGTALKTDEITWALAAVLAFHIGLFANSDLDALASVAKHATLILDNVSEIRKGPN